MNAPETVAETKAEHLLAAAPDLLAALGEIVAAYDGLDHMLGASMKAKVLRARAAIAKAGGGQ